MLFDCPATPLAVPQEIMRHVVRVESAGNPYAIGVVRGRLVRQPRRLDEAVATAKMLEQQGMNFSLGLAQVNYYNLRKHGLATYEKAFEPCANLAAGSRILRECFDRSQDWGKAFSCYYSGNFTTGFRHGYVQKVVASMHAAASAAAPAGGASALAIPVIRQTPAAGRGASHGVRLPPQADPRLAPTGPSRIGGGYGQTAVQTAVGQPAPSASVAAPAGLPQASVPAASQVVAPASGISSPPAAAAPARDSGFVF